MNIEKLLDEAETPRDKMLLEKYKEFTDSGVVLVFESNGTDIHECVFNPDFETKVIVSGVPQNLMKGISLLIAEISIHSAVPVEILQSHLNEMLDKVSGILPPSSKQGEDFSSFSDRMLKAFHSDEIQHHVTIKNPLFL